jgi:hypothetical protein
LSENLALPGKFRDNELVPNPGWREPLLRMEQVLMIEKRKGEVNVYETRGA